MSLDFQPALDKININIKLGEVIEQMENGMNYISRFPNNAQAAPHFFNENSNPELEHKTKKVTERFSENLHTIANEPSLAFFRIQEHVRKSLPQLVEKKHEVQEIQQEVQGSCFDTEYAINAVKTMRQSSVHFKNVQDLLKNAMFMKQQITYEQARKPGDSSDREAERQRPSMYRTMMRTNTVDIPVSGRSHVNEFSQSTQVTNNAGSRDGSPRARSSSMSDSPRHRRK